MGFGLLRAHDLCAGFMADVEARLPIWAKTAPKANRKAATANCLLGWKAGSRRADERDENQGEQGGQQQVGFLSVHDWKGEGE